MGVVEIPRVPDRELVIVAWVWIGVYAIGAVLTMRHVALEIRDDIDRRNFETEKSNRGLRKKDQKKLLSWDGGDLFLTVFAGAIWFVIAGFYVVKFLMFPRGFKSKFAREQERLAKAKEAEARAAEAEEDLRKMQDEVLRYLPHETPADTIRRLKRVVEGQRPDDDDPPILARSA